MKNNFLILVIANILIATTASNKNFLRPIFRDLSFKQFYRRPVTTKPLLENFTNHNLNINRKIIESALQKPRFEKISLSATDAFMRPKITDNAHSKVAYSREGVNYLSNKPTKKQIKQAKFDRLQETEKQVKQGSESG